jgi:hypothetical protein
MAWFALAFWTFSFDYSQSFFDFPIFIATLFSAMLNPVSGYLQWQLRCGEPVHDL